MIFRSLSVFKLVLLTVCLPMFVSAGRFSNPEIKTVRVALCQIFCLDGDRSGNLVRIENALQEAKKADTDIACFPETAL